jgi:hypothetical protein
LCDRGQRVGDGNQRERKGAEEKQTSNCVQAWPRLVGVSFVIPVGDMVRYDRSAGGKLRLRRDRRIDKTPLNKKQAAVYEKNIETSMRGIDRSIEVE